MWDDFKEFAVRGSMMDMAVGIIVGAAFGRIVTSLVNDVVMPPLGVLTGKVDFSQLFIALSSEEFATFEQAREAGVATINYGAFLTTVVDFLIVAVVIFFVIRGLNRLHQQDEPPAKSTQNCPYCRSTISAKASRCPKCTSEIEPTAAPATS